VQRLLTAAVGLPLLLAAIFLLPGDWFFALTVLIIDWAALEFVRLVRPQAPDAPLHGLLVLVPLAALGLAAATAAGARPWPAGAPTQAALPLVGAGLLLTVGAGCLTLLGRTPVRESLPAVGAFAFGIPYFSLGILAIYRLREIDPWLLFLGFAVVFFGDTAAFYVGRRFGRRKMAPVVSPKKSWEGAAAGLAAAIGSAAAWGWWRLGEVDAALVAVAVATAVAAQLGDLVESMLKRGSGIKDSGRLLPGHGGLLDRTDAALFALPVMLFVVWLVGPERLVP